MTVLSDAAPPVRSCRPDPPRASPDDLRVLCNPRAASGYSCVYPCPHGYRARVKKRLNLGTFPTRELAASRVVQWYRGRYGDGWRRAFARRKANPWRVRRVERAGPHGTRHVGYVADVWVRGVPCRVTAGVAVVRCPRSARDADVWPTRADAAKAVRAWVYRRIGLLAPVLLWRD